MEEKKLEYAKMKKDLLFGTVDKAISQASDVLTFMQSFKDLQTDLEKRRRELESKAKLLEAKSHELESKEKKAREIESSHVFKEKQKKLDSLQRDIASEETKLLQVQKLVQDDLKNTKEELDALQQKKGVQIPKEKDLEFQQRRYTELVKKNQSEDKKLRECTAKLGKAEVELRFTNASLKKRRVELDREERKINSEKSKLNRLHERVKEAERNLKSLNRAMEVKKKEVDSFEKRIRDCRNEKARGNNGDKGSSSKRAKM